MDIFPYQCKVAVYELGLFIGKFDCYTYRRSLPVCGGDLNHCMYLFMLRLPVMEKLRHILFSF